MESVIKLTINPADIDSYDHLNNARYPIYFENGRNDLTKKGGLDSDSLKPRGIGFQVRRASYEYNRPVNVNQQVEILSEFRKNDKATISIYQSMVHEGRIVATSIAEYFFIDLKTGKPIRPPQDLCDII